MEILFVKAANIKNVKLVKNIINEMYGSEYEKRTIDQIQKAIADGEEIYNLAFEKGKCVGFSGATINIKNNQATIEYVYVKEENRGLVVAYNLIFNLIGNLIGRGIKSALMQVQTYNKQRFLHYALSNKNIIRQTEIERKGEKYLDQILLIENLENVIHLSIKDLMKRAYNYQKEEK